MSAIAYWILVRTIIARHGSESVLATALGKDVKGNLSVLLYLVAIPIALFIPLLANGMYLAIALWWLVPDRRIEMAVAKEAWMKSHE
jgi:uncharacterized membrane protein